MKKARKIQNETVLIALYHSIDSECIPETDTVKMETIKNILVKHFAINPKELE